MSVIELPRFTFTLYGTYVVSNFTYFLNTYLLMGPFLKGIAVCKWYIHNSCLGICLVAFRKAFKAKQYSELH